MCVTWVIFLGDVFVIFLIFPQPGWLLNEGGGKSAYI